MHAKKQALPRFPRTPEALIREDGVDKRKVTLMCNFKSKNHAKPQVRNKFQWKAIIYLHADD